MIRKVGQYRYYGNDSHPDNYPEGMSKAVLGSGELFQGMSILQLGIQSAGNVRFFLNENPTSSVIIDSTGMYELNVEGMTIITGLQFDTNTITPSTKIIIDFIYEQEEGTI